MITQDDIFGITDDAAFEAAALEVFRRQAAECPPYREYLALAGVRPEEVRAAREERHFYVGQRAARQHAGMRALDKVRENETLPVEV